MQKEAMIVAASRSGQKAIVERQMRYLVNVTNERPMLHISATIVLAFTCAAPFVLLFSGLVAHGMRALIQ